MTAFATRLAMGFVCGAVSMLVFLGWCASHAKKQDDPLRAAAKETIKRHLASGKKPVI